MRTEKLFSLCSKTRYRLHQQDIQKHLAGQIYAGKTGWDEAMLLRVRGNTRGVREET